MAEVVIVGGARTAFGRFGGVWKDKTAAELGGIAIGGALFKSNVNLAEVDTVIMGMALQAGAGEILHVKRRDWAGLVGRCRRRQ